MKPLACILLIAVGLLTVPLFAADKTPISPAESKMLAGTYQIVSGERSGKPIAADRLMVISVRITRETFTTLDKTEKEVYVAKYTIDTKHTPWRISMLATRTPDKTQGTKAEGLIEQNGDTVKLIYALPGGTVPTSFKTEDKQQMFVMKRTAL